MHVLQLVVLGTPAEEGGAGKVDFIRNDAFRGINVSMMSHPWNAPVLNVLASTK